LEFILVALALAFFAGRLTHTAYEKSFTTDETAYVGTALYLWESGQYDFATTLRFHPPLAFHLAGVLLPALDLAGLEPGPNLGREILTGAGPSVVHFRMLSRLPFILLACWGAFLLYAWVREAGGPEAGLLALFLFTFSPTVLASAHLAHTDIAVSVFYVQTLYTFWRWQSRPTALRYALCGLSLGIALAAKLSAIPLAAALALLHVWSATGLPPFSNRAEGDSRLGARLARATLEYSGWIAISIVVIWLSYGGSFAAAVSQGGPTEGMLLPAYIQNFFFDVEANNLGRPLYLMGSYSNHGWWYLVWFAFLIKTPIALLGLLALAVATKRPLPDGIAPALLIPFVVYGYVVTFVLEIHLGLRYLMPILPLIHIFIALRLVPFEGRVRRAFVAFACGWIAVASIWIHPHYMAYFNESIGGPENGHEYLADSNVDWGQDLPTLAKYLRQRGNPEVWLAFFGPEHPEVHGIRSRPLRGCKPVSGLVAISVNVRRRLYSPDAAFGRPPEGCYDWLLERDLVARPGYSILVYEIPDS
jgi:4-amino-4-deoxy-L-arabinose transferase-like glycosyltransferase